MVFAVVALVGLLCTWGYSVTDVDPVPWLRIPLILLMPFGLVAALLSSGLAWAGGERQLSAVGLGISALVVSAFIILLNVMG